MHYNKDNFISNIFNKSLFEEKIYFINQVNDKILDIIKEVDGKLEDQEIYLFSEILEKKSKLRNFLRTQKLMAWYHAIVTMKFP